MGWQSAWKMYNKSRWILGVRSNRRTPPAGSDAFVVLVVHLVPRHGVPEERVTIQIETTSG